MKLLAAIALIFALPIPALAQQSDPNADWKSSYGGTRYNDKSAWDYQSKTDIEGKVTEIATSSSLIIRCKRSCEVYFMPQRWELVEAQSSVRVKFNNSPVKAFGVSRSDHDTALFFTAPMAVIKAIRDNGGYMTIEYSPYQKTPDTIKYSVWNLPQTILDRLAKSESQQRAAARKEVVDKEKEAEDKQRAQTLWAACKASGDNDSKECKAYRDRE